MGSLDDIPSVTLEMLRDALLREETRLERVRGTPEEWGTTERIKHFRDAIRVHEGRDQRARGRP